VTIQIFPFSDSSGFTVLLEYAQTCSAFTPQYLFFVYTYLLPEGPEIILLLTVLVQSMTRRLANPYPCGRIHDRTHGYKWSSLKVREEKYKRKHGEAQVEARSQDSMFLLFRCF
jgi:hypothetical protein